MIKLVDEDREVLHYLVSNPGFSVEAAQRHGLYTYDAITGERYRKAGCAHPHRLRSMAKRGLVELSQYIAGSRIPMKAQITDLGRSTWEADRRRHPDWKPAIADMNRPPSYGDRRVVNATGEVVTITAVRLAEGSPAIVQVRREHDPRSRASYHWTTLLERTSPAPPEASAPVEPVADIEPTTRPEPEPVDLDEPEQEITTATVTPKRGRAWRIAVGMAVAHKGRDGLGRVGRVVELHRADDRLIAVVQDAQRPEGQLSRVEVDHRLSLTSAPVLVPGDRVRRADGETPGTVTETHRARRLGPDFTIQLTSVSIAWDDGTTSQEDILGLVRLG